MPLPKIIFLESHVDYITPEILIKILPILAGYGYKNFYDEFPEGMDLVAAFNHFKATESMRNSLLELFSIDHTLPETLQNFILCEAMKRVESTESWIVGQFMHNEYLCSFYKNLQLKNIKYSGIDTVPISEKYFSPESGAFRSESESAIINAYRTKRMAYAYIDAENVFGKCGLDHVVDMQQFIIQSGVYSDIKNAINDYIFVYCFSQPPITHMESQFRQKAIPLPLGIINIDLTNRQSMLEGVRLLLDIIGKKTTQNSYLPDSSALANVRGWLSIYREAEEQVRLSKLPLEALWKIADPQDMKFCIRQSSDMVYPFFKTGLLLNVKLDRSKVLDIAHEDVPHDDVIRKLSL